MNRACGDEKEKIPAAGADEFHVTAEIDLGYRIDNFGNLKPEAIVNYNNLTKGN